MARIDVRITDKIAWLASKPKRIKIAVGGRGSGKSIGVSDLMLGYADRGELICCAREFQNSIDDSVHESLKQEIERLGVEGITASKTEITTSTNGRIFYKGLARNITSLKSLAGVNKLWIEEGESVSEDSLKVLTPSIRSSATSNDNEEAPPEIWITMNRGSSADAIAKKYLSRADIQLRKIGYYEDDMIMAVEVNWRDNPWFPPELQQEREDDYKNLSRTEYDHIWEGHYNDSVDNAIIPAEWFDAAIDAHLKLGFKPRGQKIVSHDPSDEGDDNKGLCYRHGSVVMQVLENPHGDINQGGDWATDYAIDVGADLFNWDCDGMGIGLKRQVESAFKGKKIDFQMFKGSESPDFPNKKYQEGSKEKGHAKSNKDIFKNKRAQYYWMLRDRFYNTYLAVIRGEYIDPDQMISISSEVEDIPGLRSEVCRIPKKPNGNGMIQIMTKLEMKKKYKIESPNRADTLMMSMRNVGRTFEDRSEEDQRYSDYIPGEQGWML